MEKLLDAGAQDVWLTPIYMKKGRIGLKLSILAAQEKEEQMMKILFAETNTLGARISRKQRRTLTRKEIMVKTEFGQAKAKIGFWEGKVLTVSPEYEDCVNLAKKTDKPLKWIYETVKRAAEKKITP